MVDQAELDALRAELQRARADEARHRNLHRRAAELCEAERIAHDRIRTPAIAVRNALRRMMAGGAVRITDEELAPLERLLSEGLEV